MPRAVIDPGVLIAALLSPVGAPAQLLLAWRAGRFDLVVSPKLLDELSRVLARRKFRRYVSEDDAEEYVDIFRRAGVVIEDPPNQVRLTADPGDDYLVALAEAAAADVLVSGDRHLLELGEMRPRVLSPRSFLERLGP